MEPNIAYREQIMSVSVRDSYKNSGVHVKGDLKADSDVDLESSCVDGSTNSTMGKVNAHRSILQDVKGHEDVTLISVTARSATSTMGTVVWMNLKNVKADSINAHKNVKIIHVECNLVSSTTDEIEALMSLANELKAHKNVILKYVTALVVKSTMGTILAENSKTKSIECHQKLEMINTEAETCKTTIGAMVIRNTERQTYQTLHAHKEIILMFADVTHEVKSTLGFVETMDCCDLGDVSCWGRLTLKGGSRATNVSVCANNDGKVVIELFGWSVIHDVIITKPINFENDVTVEIHGNGKIKGEIKFKDCKGTIVNGLK